MNNFIEFMAEVVIFAILVLILMFIIAFGSNWIAGHMEESGVPAVEASDNWLADSNTLDIPASSVEDLVKIILKNLESQSRNMESMRISLESIDNSLDYICKIISRWCAPYVLGEENGR